MIGLHTLSDLGLLRRRGASKDVKRNVEPLVDAAMQAKVPE
jgi:hypothetical protein